MTTVEYDGSLEGYFTAIFEIYEYKLSVENISDSTAQTALFHSVHKVNTQTNKSERVLAKIRKIAGNKAIRLLLCAFFSEQETSAFYGYKTIDLLLKKGESVLNDFSDPIILQMHKWQKEVGREKHRMEAFIRFEKLQNDWFVATIEPDFNVVPLILKHFKNRYQDQKWLIYDTKRQFGYMYDLEHIEHITFQDFRVEKDAFHSEESHFQSLWKNYFTNVNIKERENEKLHIKHVPKRYWKFLTEKN